MDITHKSIAAASTDWLTKHIVCNDNASDLSSWIITAAILVAISIASYYLAKLILIKIVHKLATKSSATWDDIIANEKVLRFACHMAPAICIYILGPILFRAPDTLNSNITTISTIIKAAYLYMAIAGTAMIAALMNAMVEILDKTKIAKKIHLKSFAQVAKLLLYFMSAIIILSLLIDKSPKALLAGLGAMAAVLMLVFKDSILGFVAGIHLSVNDMVRVGDWIEMPKYGADGDVIGVSLTTVKVQNWNKTISTIPANALLNDSFINWRGMSESGGRRIRRSVNIDMTSIKFCTEDMRKRFSKIQFITEYLETRQKEIAEYNTANNVDESMQINGRRLTNIGVFRAYLTEYISNHPKIHTEMTRMIRQLPPTENGLPIELYVFSNDQVWLNYEVLQADIFDHIFAIIPEFDLSVFQNPSGRDFRTITK